MDLDGNQLYYTALYWVQALPGGDAAARFLCLRDGKEHIDMKPPKKGGQREIPHERLEAFFDRLLEALKGGEIPFTDMPKSIGGDRCYQLSPLSGNSFSALFEGVSKDDFHANALVFSHESGALYVQGATGIVNVPYAGKSSAYRDLGQVRWGDMPSEYPVICEERIKIFPIPNDPDHVYVVSGMSPFNLLSINERQAVLRGLGKVEKAEVVREGYVDHDGWTIQSCDDPQMMRRVSPPMRCIHVAEKCRFSWGGMARMVEPGDKIICPGAGRHAYVVKSHKLKTGAVKLLPEKVFELLNTTRQMLKNALG